MIFSSGGRRHDHNNQCFLSWLHIGNSWIRFSLWRGEQSLCVVVVVVVVVVVLLAFDAFVAFVAFVVVVVLVVAVVFVVVVDL